MIARRLENARNEISRWTQYDYVLVNRDLNETFNELRAIVSSEREPGGAVAEAIGAIVEELLSQP